MTHTSLILALELWYSCFLPVVCCLCLFDLCWTILFFISYWYVCGHRFFHQNNGKDINSKAAKALQLQLLKDCLTLFSWGSLFFTIIYFYEIGLNWLQHSVYWSVHFWGITADWSHNVENHSQSHWYCRIHMFRLGQVHSRCLFQSAPHFFHFPSSTIWLVHASSTIIHLISAWLQ